jgi:hypothetical protein
MRNVASVFTSHRHPSYKRYSVPLHNLALPSAFYSIAYQTSLEAGLQTHPSIQTNQHISMAPFPQTLSAIAPTPTAVYSHPAMPLLTQLSALATIVTPTPYMPMASSTSISDILHDISKADIAAQPISTLDLKAKSSTPGSEGGMSTGATLGIIGGVILVCIILAAVVVKVLHH